MQTLEPDKYFHKGLAALADAHPLQAVDCFLEAMQAEQRVNPSSPDMRYLSYYGLSLSMSGRASHAALEACKRARDCDDDNPTVWLNLGRVHALSGDEREALRCLDRGLKLAPEFRDLKLELSRLNRRRAAVFAFLRRENPLNVWSGKLRGALSRGPKPTFVHPTS